jgi:hypothetical protein
MHWHTIFITQDIESIDAQARRALIEHKVTCKRTDRFNIPVFGTFLNWIGLNGKLPRIHIGVVRYGKSELSPVVATWRYMGKSHWDGYDTDQVFTEEENRDVTLIPYHSKSTQSYPGTITGAYSVLSAWHTNGRYLTFYDRYQYLINAILIFITLSGLLYTYVSYYSTLQKVVPAAAAVQEEIKTNIATGLMQIGNYEFITTTDQQVLEVLYTRQENGIKQYYAGDKWFVISQ